jgi:serine/threonine-protein kinase
VARSITPQPLAKGSVVLGRWKLERIVGEGGMGVVWAATDQKTGEPRALKFLKQADDERAHARLLREARAAKAVQHPNIAPVLEVAELPNGQPFLVMELLSGETLAARLTRKGPLPLGEMSRLLLEVIAAVEAAHAAGIVHRDLKPDNVFLLEKTDAVRVLDFGIAKEIVRSADESEASLTATGSMIGTPHYMAPEQIFGDSDIDARADVWALGVILYECITGKRPTQASGVGQVLKIIATDSIPPLSSTAPEVPLALSHLIARMLTRDRSKRPSLEVVRTALTTLEGEGFVAPASPPASAGRTLDTHEAPARPKRRASPMPWALAGVVAVGGAGVFAAARSSSSSAPETVDAAPLVLEDAQKIVDAGPPPELLTTPEEASVAEPDAAVTAIRRASGAPRDAGAKDASVSTSVDAARSANILSHDRT